MNTFLSHAVAALLDLLIKGTFLLMVAALVCRLLRRSSSAIRHLVWVSALGSFLLLPLLSLSLPRWQVPLRIAAATPASVPPARAQDSLTTRSITSEPTAPESVQKPPVLTPAHLPVVAVAVWGAGFLLVLAHFAVGLRRIGRIKRAAVPLDGSALVVADEARQQLGLGRYIEFLRASDGSAVAVPVTWGVLNPVVLLSAQSRDWSEDCLRAVLLHELAHVARWDWPMQLMGRLACALYWWHPLVWKAEHQARAESESACDDLVLMTGMRATDYAQSLVEVVCSMPEGTHNRTIAMAMAQPLEVEARIEAVLAKGRNRSHLTRRRLAIALFTVALLLLPFSALYPVARARAQSQYSTGLFIPGNGIGPQTVRQSRDGNNATPDDSNKDALRNYNGTLVKPLSEMPLKRMKSDRQSPVAKKTAVKTVKALVEPLGGSVHGQARGHNHRNVKNSDDSYDATPGDSNSQGGGGNPGDSNNDGKGGNPGDSNNDGKGGNPGDSNNAHPQNRNNANLGDGKGGNPGDSNNDGKGGNPGDSNNGAGSQMRTPVQ